MCLAHLRMHGAGVDRARMVVGLVNGGLLTAIWLARMHFWVPHNYGTGSGSQAQGKPPEHRDRGAFSSPFLKGIAASS